MRVRGQSFLNAALDARRPASAYLVCDDPIVADAYGRNAVLASGLEELADRLVRANPRPTGLFVANDWATARMYPMLIERGLQLGKDLLIVSCDNEDVRLAPLRPRPASLDINAPQLGRYIVARLLNRIRHPDDLPIVVLIPPTLVTPDGTRETESSAP
jgi:DNA-binding LacI/PurR family transcriptional regulator